MHGILDAMQQLSHYIRTAHGNSEKTYGNDPTKPKPAGLGQGNGIAPPGWSGVSTVIIEAMHQQGFGHEMWTPISKEASRSCALPL
jgi:hypothetical protein